MTEVDPLLVQTTLPLELPPVLSRRRSNTNRDTQRRCLQESIKPYINVVALRRLAATHHSLVDALKTPTPPPEALAIIELLSDLLTPRLRERIRKPGDLAPLLMVQMAHLDQEEVRVALLNTKNELLGVKTVYKGSLNAAVVRVGELYKDAIAYNSASVVICHNHPSGDPTPSPEDILFTHTALQAGVLLDIPCLDHIIVGQGKWVSLREIGVIPGRDNATEPSGHK